jgi:hypothetical protein
VVLVEVLLQTDVFSLLVDQGILGARDGALVVFLNGGCFGLGGVEDLPHKLAEVESLLGGVSLGVILGFTSGLGHTSLLFGLVAYGPASEGEEIARTRLAGVAVVRPVNVSKVCNLETVVRAPFLLSPQPAPLWGRHDLRVTIRSRFRQVTLEKSMFKALGATPVLPTPT